MLKIAIAAAVALVIGLAAGFFGGRYLLERKWSQPPAAVTPGDESAAKGGNPSPKAGTLVLGKMPIQRARQAMKEITAKDPVVATVGAVGADDKSFELHVVVENRGKCTVTEMSGVAYGFDSYGRSAPVNKGGQHYVAFTYESDAGAEPGKQATISEKLTDIDTAALAIAQIDHTTCSDGTTWARK